MNEVRGPISAHRCMTW